MKSCCVFVSIWGAILCTVLLSAEQVCAQGSAFTYQGRLANTGGPVTGLFDFQLKLRDGTNGQVGLTLTNLAVGVTNGLFTTTADFGTNALDGSARFLELGVRTNGTTNAFTILSPTQPLTSEPYALRAAVASTFPGTIGDSQVSTNIPKLNGAETFTGAVTFSNALGNFNGNLSGTFNGTASGTFSGTSSGTFSGTATGTINGNGAGLTNVNITNVIGTVPGNTTWQILQTTPQQAQVEFFYLATNNSTQMTLTLPVSPNVGNTIRISGGGSGGWKVAQNAGQSIITGNLGLPAGRSWTNHASIQAWESIASSANGSRMVAAVNNGLIWQSVDSGVTWTQLNNSGTRGWSGVASSADGTRLVGTVLNGNIYTSYDSGSNWTARAIPLGWVGVTSSSDGSKMAAAVANGNIYTSADSGSNWVARATALGWSAIAGSSDGVKLVATVNNGNIYTSTDSGSNWVLRASAGILQWTAVASSSDGGKLVAVANNDRIYVSGDSGVNWVAHDTLRQWQACACSGDGMKMVAAVSGGLIYTSFDGGQTWVARDSTNRGWQCAAYSSDGTRAVAAENNGLIWNAASTTTIGTAGFLQGIQYSALELQYIGNGQWMPLSFTGSFSAN